ncbi:hypothetical protein RvY_09038 [Ramazzottius varieornatus]|uniref:Akirin n=1 Tax=Ramazzottius varieornatus TaxID=947166 RepID=A0A1D1VDJ6_RAMVA|nr:hypothetical protein RvY_09038 [Ramazzottius varieornatus]
MTSLVGSAAKRQSSWDEEEMPISKKRHRSSPVPMDSSAPPSPTSPPRPSHALPASSSPFPDISTDPGFSDRLINELRRVQLRVNNHHRKSDGEQDSQSDHKKEINAFSPSTVRYVCSKVLKDRENEVRTEYDKVLNQKLSEQYDTFVKFVQERVQQQQSTSEPSYYS